MITQLPSTNTPSRRGPGRGIVLYDGPSLLNGERIVAILTTHSTNRKTGDVCQVWILRADRSPVDAANDGSDDTICGDCPLRGSMKRRACYVDLARGPMTVWKAWRRGLYGDATAAGRATNVEAGVCSMDPTRRDPSAADAPAAALLRRATIGRVVRLGAYGDPAALPRSVLLAAVRHARGHTGYTHAWRHGFAIADLVMASCESARDVADASAYGFRAFVLTSAAEPRRAGHMHCPASAERGHRLTCEACLACGGTSRGASSHVQIAAHGTEHTRRVALRVLQWSEARSATL